MWTFPVRTLQMGLCDVFAQAVMFHFFTPTISTPQTPAPLATPRVGVVKVCVFQVTPDASGRYIVKECVACTTPETGNPMRGVGCVRRHLTRVLRVIY